MRRRYHSPKRLNSKAQTIQQIVAAAMKLHGQGITDLPSVAREAGVSLATVTKYFPTREALFRGCTAHFLKENPPPSPEGWALIQDPQERLERAVADLYGLHEAAFGQTWLAYRLAGKSQVMAETVAAVEALCREAAQVIVGDSLPEGWRAEAVAFVAGIVSPLTYRSLRRVSGFDRDTARRWATQAIRLILAIPAGGSEP
jgi:AcrR family transcriptional regulator